MFNKKPKTMKPEREISSAEEAIVAIWDNIMIRWKEGDEASKQMLLGAAPEVRAAYAKVYGDNVVPIFAAMGRKKAA